MMKQTFLKLLLLFALMASTHSVMGQTFVCTNVTMDKEDDARRVEKVKKQALGATMTLTFYDKDVVAEIVGKDSDDKEKIVFGIVDSKTLKATKRNDTAEIQLDKLIEYIKGFTMTITTDNTKKESSISKENNSTR